MVMSLATANFTPEEEHLVQLLPPSTSIDSKWISEADSLISGTYASLPSRGSVSVLFSSRWQCPIESHFEVVDSIKQSGQELEALKNLVGETRDEVKSMASSMRVLLSDHYKILVDVRSLLKSMMKVLAVSAPAGGRKDERERV